MARFEIETSVKDAGKTEKNLSDVSKELGTLESRYKRLQGTMGSLSNSSRNLGGALLKLNKDFKSGAITERQFEQQSKSLKIALENVGVSADRTSRRMASLQATMKQNATSQGQLGQATKRLTGYHRDFQGGIRSSNAVAVEFGRIIQDAPYGIQGVANNLQQLTQNFSYYARAAREAAAAQGKTISTFGLLRGAVSSLLNPLNLLTIGVSLVTAGFIAYQKWGGSAKKATDEVKQSFDDYLGTLENVRAATLKGQADAQKDIANLRILYGVTQDVTLALKDRVGAVKALQQEYPDTFSNLTQEQILAGEAAESYNKLTASIVAVAKAKGFSNQIAENSIKLIGEEAKLLDARIKQAEAQARFDAAPGAITPSNTGLSPTSVFNIQRDRAQSALIEANKEVRDITANIRDLNQENLKYEAEITEQIKSGSLAASDLVGGLKETKSQAREVSEVIEKVASASQNIDTIWREGFSNSIDNSLSQLKELHSELNKIKNEGAFDPFDRSGVFSRGPATPSQDPATGVSFLNKALSEIDPKGSAEETEKELNRVMTRSVQRFGNEFYKIVTDIGQYSEDTFKGAISDIVGRLTSSFGDVFTSIIGTGLKDVIKANLDDLEFGGLSKDISKAVVAGAGIAGSIISGATSPTSSIGQGLGGALSGAAAGTAIAPGIGTAIGAIVGGIAGLFGASSARKKERELLEKQLEEQRKQTELLRESSLAFTSQIIGQMTNQGIVTGVDRNEFGDIVFRLEGNDLVGSVSRTEIAKGRGL